MVYTLIPIEVQGAPLAQSLEHSVLILEVAGLNPARTCVCGVCFIQSVAPRPYVSGMTSTKAKTTKLNDNNSVKQL